MKLINDKDTLNKYLGFGDSFEFDEIASQLEQANLKYLESYIGLAQLEEISGLDSDSSLKQALEFIEANFAAFEYLPKAAVQINSAGVFTTSANKEQAASSGEKNELLRMYQKAGYTKLDHVLLTLFDNPETYPKFHAKSQVEDIKYHLVNHPSDFESVYSIENSMIVFISLNSAINIAVDRYVIDKVGTVLYHELKEEKENVIWNSVRSDLKKAICCYAISEKENTQFFHFIGKSIYKRFDRLSYEFNPNKQAKALKMETENNMKELGEMYLNRAMKLIRSNSEIFPSFNETADTGGKMIYETKGIKGVF